MKANTILTRTLSGILYIAVIVGCLCAGYTGTVVLAALLAVGAVIEFQKIALGRLCLPTLLIDIAITLSLIFIVLEPPVGALILVLALLIRFIEQLYIKDSAPLSHLGVSAFSAAYIGIPMAVMTIIGVVFSSWLLLPVFIMIWVNDTGAFLVGCSCGRHHLFPRISPKKTWEGFFGGLGFNIIFAFIFSYFCPLSWFGNFFNSLPQWIGLAVVVTTFSTWGDLTESLIKRTLNIKDSGHIIPGHGGILDRIDSLLFVMPATLLYIFLLLILQN